MKVKIENNLTGKVIMVEAKSVISKITPPATMVEFIDPMNPEGSGYMWFSDDSPTQASTYATYTLLAM